MSDAAWNHLVAYFGKPHVVANAHLRRIYTFPPVKAYVSVTMVKSSRKVTTCLQFLTKMNNVGDLQSEGVLSSATRKLPFNKKTKWMTYARQKATYYMGLEAFSLWLLPIAVVQDNVLMKFNFNAEKSERTGEDKTKNSTLWTFIDDITDKNTGHDGSLKDDKHPLWEYETSLKRTC